MDDSITFHVVGSPTSKGSFTRMPNGAMLPAGTAKSRNAKEQWRTDCRNAAMVAMGERMPSRLPIRLLVEFRLPCPKSIRKYQWGWLPHTTYPDIDKLLRALLDALTGIVWADDAQVCYQTGNKGYAWNGQPGAYVVVDFMSETSVQGIAFAQRKMIDVLGSL
jgi:crossover junction endodeoxyribonuclease RusA